MERPGTEHGPTPGDGEATLLTRAARSMFWNAALLPLITAFNLVSSVLIRNYFGLASGLYDALIGVVNSLTLWPGLGIPVAFTQFIPELETRDDRHAVWTFVRRAGTLRILSLALFLVPVNVNAAAVGEIFHLGPHGATLVYLASVLALLRAGHELALKTLQSLLSHLAANVIQLTQAVLAVAALAIVLGAGLGMTQVMVALVVASAVLLVIAAGVVRRRISRVASKPRPVADEVSAPQSRAIVPGVSVRRFAGFSLFMYAHDTMNYFASPAFASLAIAAMYDTPAPVALFAAGLQFPMLTVVVVLAGFQGLYRPLFARLINDAEPRRMRAAFSEVSKVQAALLLPTGTGLAIVVGDLIPLLYGEVFAEAVPLARVLCVFLFAEAVFNLGTIVLSLDHQYRSVMLAQAMRVLGAPLFVWLAARGDLRLAAAAFGLSRVAATLFGYAVAQRRFGVRFPFAFALRAAVPSAVMLLILTAIRSIWSTSWIEVITLMVVGVVVIALGMRLCRVLGPAELDLIDRTQLPGRSTIIAWLKPRV